MKSDVMPEVLFQQSIFKRDTLMEKWPHLHRVISNGDELAVAFEAARQHPMWRDDPRLANLSPDIAQEVLDLYNAVIADGRYLAEFQADPGAVAKRLGLTVSSEAIAVVSTVASRMDGDVGVVGAAVVVSVAVVGIAVATAIVSSAADPRARILIDESGRVKLGDERKTETKSKSKKTRLKTKRQR
jgi:hypothetical protein